LLCKVLNIKLGTTKKEFEVFQMSGVKSGNLTSAMILSNVFHDFLSENQNQKPLKSSIAYKWTKRMIVNTMPEGELLGVLLSEE
jgi:hypothetical protein